MKCGRDANGPRWSRWWSALCVIAAPLWGPMTTPAAAQESCARLIAEAADAYQSGRLDVVLERTGSCLDRRPSSGELESVFVFHTRVYLALDELEKAREAALLLLQVNPDFTPSLDDPARFRTLVAGVKRDLAREGVSSVSKTTESVPEAPATVVVVTADHIRQRGYQDLEEVLHDLPGFDISRTNGQSYSSIYQRGYVSDATNRTLFLVDGVEQNDLFSNIAYISRQYPLSNIDRIEVVYGPASTMYGANAFLGVINVLTRDPDDILGETRNIGGEAHLGGGPWNTRSFDGTLAGRFRGTSFSVTGRLFRSDEWDLSGFDEWNYQYDPARYGQRSMFGGLAARAAALDRPALRSVNGAPVEFSDSSKDWMISGKLKVKEFLFGLQMWETREGAASSSTQWAEPGARNGNIWVPRQTSFYARYSTALPGNLRLSYFGQAKVHQLKPESSVFLLQSYISGPFGAYDLLTEDLFDITQGAFGKVAPEAFWAQARLAQSSNQLRHEMNLSYRARSNLSLVGGVDVRHGSLQTDYSQSSNCTVESLPGIFIPDDVDPLTLLQTDISDLNLSELLLYFNLFTRLYDRGGAFLGFESARPRCTRSSDRVLEPVTGGEHRAAREVGVFAQSSFNPVADIRLVAGLRIDNGHVTPGSSYGTVVTPRLAFVYSPGQFVFKAIYAEAFKEPANLERFSPPDPIGFPVSEPALTPERVRNLEVSASRQGRAYSADVSLYRARYNDVIGVNQFQLYDELNAAGFGRFSDRFADQWYYTPCPILQCFVNALRQLPNADDRRRLTENFFNFDVTQLQFRNLATLNVWGAQVNTSWQFRGMGVFGNYTYTHPAPVQGSLRIVRIGDIASHRGTVGLTHGWQKWTASLRVNITGTRYSGNSRDVAAYLSTQGDRELFFDPVESTLNVSQIDPYAAAHAAASYDLLTGLTLQATINNVFNTSYADPGIRTADNIRFAARVPQPGRSVFVRLLTRF